MRKPDFNNFRDILEGKATNRPALFELFMNGPLYERLAGKPNPNSKDYAETIIFLSEAFAAAGYDYTSVGLPNFGFPVQRAAKSTLSLNEGAGMTNRRAFEEYPWQDPEAADYTVLERVAPHLPEGMKLMIMGPSCVLENTTALIGYENLCMMIHDDPVLLQDIFDAVGSRLLRYYELAIKYDSVGILMSNDDWGFNTQTFLSVEDMRKYVFPWHKKIVEAGHKAGKPVILHSCGNFDQVMDDVIDNMKFNAKHSYEDVILPVEDAYEKWGSRIAILGGMDVDFLIRSTTDEIKKRSRDMLDRTRERGNYALGSGNSVPEYIPQENYLAMISVV